MNQPEFLETWSNDNVPEAWRTITRTELLAAGGLAGLQTSTGRKLSDIKAAAMDTLASDGKTQPAPRNAKRRLVLPMPPSTNRYWRNFRGITVISEEAKAYKAGAAESAKAQGATVLDCPVSVTVWVYRGRKAGDLDNRLKVVLDALQGICYANDDQIVEIHAYRHDDKGNARIEVEVEAAQ